MIGIDMPVPIPVSLMRMDFALSLVHLRPIIVRVPMPVVVFRHSTKLTRLPTPHDDADTRRAYHNSMVRRPCLLIIDREHSASISTRKLVIESAKFNVITAYSGTEALETFERFPNVDGMVLNSTIHDVPCEQIVATIRARTPNAPIIVVQGPGAQSCAGASHYVDSFDPATLLELLHKLFPREVSAIEQQDDALKAKENRD